MNDTKIVECHRCGEEHEPRRLPIENPDRRFCSTECYIEWKNAGDGLMLVECSICGKETAVRRAGVADKLRVCGEGCLSQYHRENESRGDTPRSRTYFWKKQRERALKRDDYTCQRCGLGLDAARESGKHPPEVGLHVHHIRPFRSFEEPKQAHDLENLRTLCFDCHMTVEHGR